MKRADLEHIIRAADRRYCTAAARAGLVDEAVLRQRLKETKFDPRVRELVEDLIGRHFSP